jgi:hypothetical protein
MSAGKVTQMSESKHETVEVAAGRMIYHGGGHHSFAAGTKVPLPAAHAAELRKGGHVVEIGAAENEQADEA